MTFSLCPKVFHVHLNKVFSKTGIVFMTTIVYHNTKKRLSSSLSLSNSKSDTLPYDSLRSKLSRSALRSTTGRFLVVTCGLRDAVECTVHRGVTICYVAVITHFNSRSFLLLANKCLCESSTVCIMEYS
jgi:hypothetical protein